MGMHTRRLQMKKFVLAGAALALAMGTAYAENVVKKSEDKVENKVKQQEQHGGAFNNDTAFRVLDKNHDGYLSKAEAAGNPALAKRWAEADKNKDGKLSRMEYFRIMAKIDTNTGANKVSKSTEPKSSAAGGTK